MITINIFVAPANAPWQKHTHAVSVEQILECYKLMRGKNFDVFAYWRNITGNDAIAGTVLIWTEAEENAND